MKRATLRIHYFRCFDTPYGGNGNTYVARLESIDPLVMFGSYPFHIPMQFGRRSWAEAREALIEHIKQTLQYLEEQEPLPPDETIEIMGVAEKRKERNG